MNSLKVEIDDDQVEMFSFPGEDGKTVTMRRQTGYLLGKKRALAFLVPLQPDQNPYHPGVYELDAHDLLGSDVNGKLTLKKRWSLQPVGTKPSKIAAE